MERIIKAVFDSSVVVAAVAAVLAAASLFSCTIQQEKKSEVQRNISVTGTGTVRVKNDAATINMAVVTYNRSVIDAAARNAEAVTKVREDLLAAGFPADSITTSGYRIYQDVQNRNGVQYRGDYRVSNSVHIVVRDISRAGDAIDTAVRAGANEFSSIEFSATDTDDALREARTLAVKNAYEAANLMAKTSGASLGKVISITEQGGAPVYARAMNSAMMKADSISTPISGGEQEVSVSVFVTYELTD